MSAGRSEVRGGGRPGFGRRQGALVRSFVALALPEPVRAFCGELAARLARRSGGEGVRWVRAGAYHVTLRFLGNLSGEQVAELVDRLRQTVASHPPFELGVGAPLLFPPGRRPKVVALSLEPTEPLQTLAACVERAAARVGLEPERRRFHAHLTLGRIRSRRWPSLEASPAPGIPPWRVEGVVLFRSDLSPDGARYAPMATCPLGAELSAPTALHSP